MKLFEMPYIDVLKFAVQDVIATSSEEEEEPMLPSTAMGCIG